MKKLHNYIEPKLRSAIKWYGGKFYLARRIISLMPPRRMTFVEPYCGALNVMLNRQLSSCEHANDIDIHLINMWRCLQSYPEKLLFTLRNTIYSETTWNQACSILESKRQYEAYVLAVATICKYRMSRGGMGKTFAWSDRLRGKRQPGGAIAGELNSWNTFVNQDLLRIIDRIRCIQFSNLNAISVINQFRDDEDALLYLDPPYLQETRTAKEVYENEMTFEDHYEMLCAIMDAKCMIALSGYHNPLYDRNLKNWLCVDIDIANSSGQGKIKQRRTEALWLNPPAFPYVQKELDIQVKL